jgi:peroxiredoxin Q/BCP
VIEIGAKAPEFEAESTAGPLVLASLLEASPVVLYFFPKANTPGCTNEAIEFNQLLEDFVEAGVRVIGSSVDTLKTLQGFSDKHDLSFALVSDRSREIGEAYGVLKTDRNGSHERDTVVIGRDGTVALAYRKVKGQGHAADVLADVRAASAEKRLS